MTRKLFAVPLAVVLAGSVLSACTASDQGCGGVLRPTKDGTRSTCETDLTGRGGGGGGVGKVGTPSGSPSTNPNSPPPADAPAGSATP